VRIEENMFLVAGSGIRVMTIAPGIFDTPMMAGLPEEARAPLGKQVLPLHGLAGPRSMRISSSTSSRTRCSTARSSGWTVRSGWRRGNLRRSFRGR
jgi:NAD(P)-dependent dehydrogenase (short-subunit alcohol dehydrogenase family)